MNERLAELARRIQHLEAEFAAEVGRGREEIAYTIHNGKVHFHESVVAQHRALRRAISRQILEAPPLLLLTAPLIYAIAAPLALLDLLATIYQSICFPIYGIGRVRRTEYVVFDRTQLAYLNALERFNCRYCSYANGVIAYAREVASKTEQYWCPIKHATRPVAPHERYGQFTEFGDAVGYRRDLDTLRKAVQQEVAPKAAP